MDEQPEIPTEYLEYKRQLQDINRKTQEELYKSLITLSTVMIGVSLTLRQQFITGGLSIWLSLLSFIPIAILILCVSTVLRSHHLSMSVTDKIIEDIDKGRDIGDTYMDTKRIQRLNAKSSQLFFAGLIAVVIFAILGATGTMKL